MVPVGGVLIQDRLHGRPTPSEGDEDQHAGARGDSQYPPEKPHGFGYQGVRDSRVPGHGEPMEGPGVAEGLKRFAESFAAPERRRYVPEPATPSNGRPASTTTY